MDKENSTWSRQAQGWYTSPERGGIVKEEEGWYLYSFKTWRTGPYPTLKAAQLAAEVALSIS